jgi:magnesium-protoporphyrin O-methyltransferase
MTSSSYIAQRARLQEYFDRTAVDAWARLTSSAPVGSIRATVRAGRDRMRELLLSWLPAELDGARLLDAGCGTGALALQAARRGADVLAVDLSPTLVQLARERCADELANLAGQSGSGGVTFRDGDMLALELGSFDHVVAMDSMIHYRSDDMVAALSVLAQRTRRSIVFTFAPRNPLLATMHVVGRLFPRGNRAPFIEPVSEERLRALIAEAPALRGWTVGRSERIASGFYTSQAMELVRA